MSLKKLVDLDLLGRAVTKIKALIPNAASAAPGKVAASSSQGSSASYARQDHTHGIDLATGDANGQVKIAGNNVSVKGLAALAYKASLGKSDVGLGNVDNVKQYSASNPPPYPVTSVNGSTGAVTVSVPSAGTATPKMDGTAAVGTSAKFAKEDHVHPVDTSRAAASHTHSADNVLGGYLNIHPENSPTLIPFMHNDIAHLLSRGGSAIVKYDGTQQSVDISAVFDGSGSYWGINPTGITTIVIELTLHRVFTWTNWIYADFGAVNWLSKSVSVDVINTNYADDVWTNKYQTTSNELGHIAFRVLHTPVGATHAGGGFNKVRFTFSVWATSTIFRISQLGIYNFGSLGLRETYMSRGVDDAVFRSITPNANVTYNLGSSSNKWNHAYAKYLNDTEIPASPKFTDTTDLGSMTGTLGAEHGGTGKTNTTDAANVFMNALGTGSSTPTDADYYISQYVNGGTTTTTYHRRPMSALWEYVKGKISSVLGLTASSYGGSAAKVNNHTVAVDVPSGAKFTDTTYSAGDGLIQNGTKFSDHRGIEYIRGTWTAASGTWTGVSTDTELYDGKQIILYMPFSGSGSNVTLNLTLAGGGTTGAKDVYYESTTRFTTHKGQNSQLHLIYHDALTLSNGTTYQGWWYVANRDTTNVGQLSRIYNSIKAKAAIYRYQILLTYDGEYLLPVSNGNNNASANKTMTTEKFDPFGQIYYWLSTTTVSANAKINDWNHCMSHFNNALIDLRYAFNTGTTLTANKAIYLVCVPQSDGSAKLHATPISQTLPTTEDGFIYKYLGQAYDNYRITLDEDKPCYYYKNGSLRLWINQDTNAATVNGHTVAVDVPANAKFTDTTYTSKTAASGGTDVSLVTTGEKYIWNAKGSGTITGIKMNGVSKGTSGVVDLGTVITEHQSLSGKQDKLVSGTNIKTINGTSLLGSGNIEISSGGSSSIKVFVNLPVPADSWTDTGNDELAFRASITLPGVTTSYAPIVTFTPDQLNTYILSPMAETYDGGVYIYSDELIQDAMTIPSIICIKGD